MTNANERRHLFVPSDESSRSRRIYPVDLVSIAMNSPYSDHALVRSSNKFDWIDRIRSVVENKRGEPIDFDQLRKEIIGQYRQAKPHSDKTSKELTMQLESNLAKAPFITRLGNDIYYLYYLRHDKLDFY